MARSNFVRERNDDDTWSLHWVLEDDLGGILGDLHSGTTEDVEPSDVGSEDHECWRAAMAASPFAKERRKYHGFVFKDEKTCKAAQQAADAAIRNKPIEEWEAKALAAGWKPPKGWKKGGE